MAAGTAFGAQFQAAVQQVEVYATVTDPQGRPITGLPAAAFEVREDGVVQVVSTVVQGAFPVAVALLVDRSFNIATPACVPGRVTPPMAPCAVARSLRRASYA